MDEDAAKLAVALIGLCRCERVGEDPHTCPFKREIHEDSESLCNCCSDCTDNCRGSI